MARRQRISASDYAVDDYGGEDYYDQEYDQEEQAIRESKKLFKQQKKAQKSKWRRFRTTLSQLVCCAEAKGVQETDIDALEALFPGQENLRPNEVCRLLRIHPLQNARFLRRP